jgi:hypothetical protein
MKNEIKQRSETKWIAGIIVALGAILLSPSSALALYPWTNYFQGFETGEDWAGTTTQHASGTFGITAATGNGFGLVSPTGFSYPGSVNHGISNAAFLAGIESPGRTFTSGDLYFDMDAGTVGQQFYWYNQLWHANATDSTAVLAIGTKSASGWSVLLADFFGSTGSFSITGTGWYTFRNVWEDNGFGYWKHTAQLVRKTDSTVVLTQANNYNGYASQLITNYAGWIQAGIATMDAISNPSAGYSGIAIDNVSFVPEPASVSLLALGGLLLLRRK